jgi:glutamyl-tRNA synthetase
MSEIRTRFAPSPTGRLHVGGLRTALYNYLFAKRNGGKFILRIEDTDQTRLVPGAVEDIMQNMNWANISLDEGPAIGGDFGPYVQSQRLDLYKKHALQLVAEGKAYYCFCSSERLEKVRQLQTLQKQPPAYDRQCRDLSADEVKEKLDQGQPYVIRMKIPLEGEIVFTDLIRGLVSITYKVVDDQVLLKSDGFPTYHLAVVVDDHYMKISHVIRGEEWLPSTPKHLLLYQYFGWQAPAFAHLPLLLNPDKSKLSKRHGDVSVSDYHAKGYLPEALINFVAMLGWNPGDGDTREFFSMDDLMKEFSLEHVGKSGAVFNLEKLDWLNQQYIHRMNNEELLIRLKPLFKEKGWDNRSDEYLKQTIELLKERVTVLPDFLAHGEYFFVDPTTYDEKSKAKNWTPESSKQVQEMAQSFAALTTFDAASIEQVLRKYAETLNISAGKLIHPLRLALTGVSNGPSLFHLVEVLGKDVVLTRIATAVKILG